MSYQDLIWPGGLFFISFFTRDPQCFVERPCSSLFPRLHFHKGLQLVVERESRDGEKERAVVTCPFPNTRQLGRTVILHPGPLTHTRKHSGPASSFYSALCFIAMVPSASARGSTTNLFECVSERAVTLACSL